MNWKGRKVFITGATGLLGAHLVDYLSQLGAECVCLIRDYVPTARFYSLGWTNPVQVRGDVNDFNVVNRIINEYQIETVFHLAAQTQVGVANKNPIPTLQTNIMGTINVLEACRLNSNVEEVIVASSDKAYGSAPVLPYSEDTPLHGLHPYDVSKSCADLIAQTYRNTYSLNVGVTRCGNLFGPGDLNFNRLVPGTIRDLLSGRPPTIRSDGKMIRDYFYVKDAVLAYKWLAEWLHKEPNQVHLPETVFCFNFSSGSPLTVLELVDLIQMCLETHFEPVILNQATYEISKQYLDSSLARAFGWKPQWHRETALIETVAWYRNYLKENE